LPKGKSSSGLKKRTIRAGDIGHVSSIPPSVVIRQEVSMSSRSLLGLVILIAQADDPPVDPMGSFAPTGL